MPKDLGFQPTPGFPNVFENDSVIHGFPRMRMTFGLGTPAVPFFPAPFRGGV